MFIEVEDVKVSWHDFTKSRQGCSKEEQEKEGRRRRRGLAPVSRGRGVGGKDGDVEIQDEDFEERSDNSVLDQCACCRLDARVGCPSSPKFATKEVDEASPCSPLKSFESSMASLAPGPDEIRQANTEIE